MLWWSGAFGRSHSHNGMIQLTQCDKPNTRDLRCKKAIRHYKTKITIINKAWNLRRIWTAVKKTWNILNIHDYHRLSRSCYKTGTSNSGPYVHRRFPLPNMLKTWKNSRSSCWFWAFCARAIFIWRTWFLQEKSKVFEVGKPIEKHVLLVSFLQLHFLHTLRSTSLISNVSLTLKWFKCFFPCH